jgi:hypothetical protein
MRRLRLLPLLLALIALPVLAAAQPAPPVKPDTKELAKLAKLDKAQAAAKAAYLKNKTNAKLRQAYIDTSMAAGKAYRITPAVGSRVKYPKSLRYFREVRKVDPKNKDAIMYIEEMESIYRSIGKPIPPA